MKEPPRTRGSKRGRLTTFSEHPRFLPSSSPSFLELPPLGVSCPEKSFSIYFSLSYFSEVSLGSVVLTCGVHVPVEGVGITSFTTTGYSIYTCIEITLTCRGKQLLVNTDGDSEACPKSNRDQAPMVTLACSPFWSRQHEEVQRGDSKSII